MFCQKIRIFVKQGFAEKNKKTFICLVFSGVITIVRVVIIGIKIRSLTAVRIVVIIIIIIKLFVRIFIFVKSFGRIFIFIKIFAGSLLYFESSFDSSILLWGNNRVGFNVGW